MSRSNCFFEGILLRLTQHTGAHDTLTANQLGTRPGRQIHDANYALLAIIQHNWAQANPQHTRRSWTTPQPTRAFTEVALQHSYTNLISWEKCDITCAPALRVQIRVLNEGIAFHQTVPILRGLPEDNLLRPTLLGIVSADLINHLKGNSQTPQFSTTQNTYGFANF
jgi:hypothetical protein